MFLRPPSSTYTLDVTADSLVVTIHNRGRGCSAWADMIPRLVGVLIGLLLTLGLSAGWAQNHLPAFIQAVFVLFCGIAFLGLFSSSLRQSLDIFFSQEKLIVSEQGIQIERTGILNLKVRKRYPASQIKGLGTWMFKSSPLGPIFSLGVGPLVILLNRRFRPVEMVGRGLSQTDAATILVAIQRRYPHYK